MDKFLENYGHSIIAELYDNAETGTEDIDLIQSLIKDKGRLNILECFCGTGRILIPLALDGHNITGIDLSAPMLEQAKKKIEKLDDEVKGRINLINGDITKVDWGRDYDLIIIGANAFYELPTPDLQEVTIKMAYEALKKDGLIFIDNDDYKGNWGYTQRFYNERVTFEGQCEDGSYGKLMAKNTSFDQSSNILQYKRMLHIVDTQGHETVLEYYGQKHPVTKEEVEGWLNRYNFSIIELFGSRDCTPYTDESYRAIFLGKK